MIRALRSASLVSLCLVACKKGDKVPAYVTIPEVKLTTNVDEQGSNTIRATDAWVYANDELLGCWELPARIPVLQEGDVTIQVTPGVKRNGTFDDRLMYPFYAPWTGTAQLVPTGGITVDPVVQYTPNATFWVESFLGSGHNLLTSANSDTVLLVQEAQEAPDLALDDTPFGGFVLEPGRSYIQVYTDQDFAATGGPTFLEMDYRCNMQFTVGLLYTSNGVAQSQDYVTIEPTTQHGGTSAWKKIYIDLSTPFNSAISQRDIYISGTLPSGYAQGHVYFDNIKLVR